MPPLVGARVGALVTPPVNDLGNDFRKCEGGWADPDCVYCHGSGEVGFGSEQESCDCVVDDVNTTADADAHPSRYEGGM